MAFPFQRARAAGLMGWANLIHAHFQLRALPRFIAQQARCPLPMEI